jgi:guanylate kinase
MPGNSTDVEQIVRQVTGRLPRRLFVLAGPSGVGKNTIIRKLLANHPGEMARVRTYTTRTPREGEVHGEQYFFVTKDEFRALALDNRLMEANASNLDGHDVYGLGKAYSMPMDIYEGIPEESHLVVAEVDIAGTRRLKERYPDCVTIFITAPPLELLKRILKRQDETMDAHSLFHRLRTARDQIRAAREYDYVLFNQEGELDETLVRIETIIEAERNRVQPGFDLEKVIPPGAFDALAEDANGNSGA